MSLETQDADDPQIAFPAAVTVPWQLLDFGLVGLLLLVAVIVRLHYTDPALSFDELWHLGSTKGVGNSLALYPHDVVIHNAMRLTSLDNAGPVWKVWTGMDGILHPPLFLILLRLWRDLFGESDYVAHCFSIAWSLIAIGFCFATARMAMNRTLGALCALAVVLSQTQVYFAQEVRSYSMLIALGSIALWLMTRIELTGPTRKRVIALGLLTLPIQLTHYFGFGGALAIGVYGLLRGGRHRWAFVASVAASAAFFMVAWMPFALRQIASLGTGDAFLHLDRGVWHILLLAAGVPFRLIAERDYEIEFTPVLSCVLFVMPWFLIRRLRALLPWAIWLVLSVLPLVMLDYARTTVHMAYPRYFAIASPAVPLLFAGVVWALRRKLAYLMASAVALMGGIYLYSGNKMPLDSDDFSAATRLIEARVQPGDAMVTYSGGAPAYYVDVLMLTLSHSHKLFPGTLVMLTKPMTPAMVNDLGTRTVWILSGPLDRPAEELIPGGRVTYAAVAERTAMVTRIQIDPPATTTAP